VRKRDMRFERGDREYYLGLKVCKRIFLGVLRLCYEGTRYLMLQSVLF
jgi:hypothetical protein